MVVTEEIVKRNEFLVNINNSSNSSNNNDTKTSKSQRLLLLLPDFHEIFYFRRDHLQANFQEKNIFYDVYGVFCYRSCSIMFAAKEASVV